MRWMRRIFRGTIVVLALIGVLSLIVTFTPLVSWWAHRLAGKFSDPRGEILIVLGGNAPADGIVGESSYLRSEYAVRAYRSGRFQTVVLSGGGKPVPIAESMQDFLEFHHVPASAILLEPQSMSTRENAIRVRELVAAMPGTKVLMTSDYHMYRALRAFRKAGIDVLPRPIPDAIKRSTRCQGRWSAFCDVFEETMKIAYYRLRNWI